VLRARMLAAHGCVRMYNSVCSSGAAAVPVQCLLAGRCKAGASGVIRGCAQV
jgi:hypothetical protein